MKKLLLITLLLCSYSGFAQIDGFDNYVKEQKKNIK